MRLGIPRHPSCDLIFRNERANNYSSNAPSCSNTTIVGNGHIERTDEHSCNSGDSECDTCSESDENEGQPADSSMSKMLDASKKRRIKKKTKDKENEVRTLLFTESPLTFNVESTYVGRT